MLIGAREEKKNRPTKTGKREKNNQQKRKRETEKNKNAEKFGKPKPNFLVPLNLTAFQIFHPLHRYELPSANDKKNIL